MNQDNSIFSIQNSNDEMLIRLLRELSIKALDPDDNPNIILQFEEIYSNSNYRHSYSEIAGLIYSLYKGNKNNHTILLLNIQQVYEKIAKRETSQTSVVKGVFKLKDHINFEIRCLDIKDIKDRIEKLSEEIDTYGKSLETLQQESKDIKHTIHKESISLMSIFTAVIIGIFGWISFNSKIIEALSTPTPLKNIVTIFTLSVFLLISIILIILHYIHNISTGKNCNWDGYLYFTFVIVVILCITYGFIPKEIQITPIKKIDQNINLHIPPNIP